MKSSDEKNSSLVRGSARICAFLAVGLGVTGLLGWVGRLPLLTTFGSGLIPIAPSTALLFICFGTGAALLPKVETNRRAYGIGMVLGMTGTLAALVLLVLSSSGIRPEAEHLGFQFVGPMNGEHFGHISPLTAFFFLPVGVSFFALLTASSNKAWQTALSLGSASLVLLAGLMLLLAYLLGAPLLYDSKTIPPALPTSLGLALMGLSLFLSSGKRIFPQWDLFPLGVKRVECKLILVFLVLVIGILSLGYLYFKNQKNHYRVEVERQLSIITDLKVGELMQWRKERLVDAEIFYKNPTFSRLVGGYLKNPRDSHVQSLLRIWLGKVQSASAYDRVLLLDTQGRERLAVPDKPETAVQCLREHVFQVLRSGKVTFMDFHREQTSSPIHLSLLIPIMESGNRERPSGVLVLRINPSTYLYPLINKWPTASRTAETLLVRREGDEVVYLNELRFQKNTALNLRSPLENTFLPAVKAVLGQEGIVQGIDYRDVPVTACPRSVPDSPWFLVALMDRAEIFEPLRDKLWLMVILISTLLLAVGSGVVLIWRQQALFYYRERLQAAEALQASETRYRETLDNMLEGCQIIGFDWRYRYVNDSAARDGRQAKEDLLGRTMMERYPGIESTELFEVLRNCLEKRESRILENAFTFPDGTRKWFELSIQTVPEGIFILSLDITGRKRAEEREKHLNAVLKAIRGVNQLIVRERDRNQLIREACTILTSTRGFHSVWIALVDEAGRFSIMAESGISGECGLITEMLKQNRWPRCAEEVWRRSGVILVEGSNSTCRECPLADHHGNTDALAIRLEYGRKVYGLMVVSLPGEMAADGDEQDLFKEAAGDIAFSLYLLEQEEMRSKAEAALRESEEKVKTIFECAPDAVYLYDLEGRFLDGNKAAENLSGYKKEEFIGRTFGELGLLGGKELAKGFKLLEKNRQGLAAGPEEFPVIRKDGQTIPLEIRTFPLRIGNDLMVLAIARDISERKKMEAQLFQSQKLESIGRLAGGVAHDFNNLLTTILGNAQFGLAETKPEELSRELFQEIKEVGEKAAGLTRQLLAFSRKQVLQFEVVDLNEIVLGAEKILKRIIGEDIEMRSLLAEDLSLVEADSGQMEQVIINLAVNARDAMPKGGKLTIETANIELDEEYASVHGSVKPGSYALLSLSDTGIGISPEVQAQIFEPFFTTKEKGKGTGLGLSTVYGIIKQTKGNIWVYSEVGHGTTFKIYLPRVNEPGEKEKRKRETEREGRLSGSETVLVSEDDEKVRNLTERILQKYGYRVLSVGSGPEALKRYEDRDGPIHLLLTDVIMPQMSGRELAETLKTRQADLKVIYMSGYTDNSIVHHGILEKGIDFIQKPFLPEELARKVREVLDR